MPRYTKNVGLMAQCITNINLSYKPTFYWCLKAVANKATWRARKRFSIPTFKFIVFSRSPETLPLFNAHWKWIPRTDHAVFVLYQKIIPPYSHSSVYPPTSVYSGTAPGQAQPTTRSAGATFALRAFHTARIFAGGIHDFLSRSRSVRNGGALRIVITVQMGGSINSRRFEPGNFSRFFSLLIRLQSPSKALKAPVRWWWWWWIEWARKCY